jgi:RpiR family carbohydrate utilization transcriptional regulator
MMGAGDAAVAISNTGLSEGIIEAARIAREKGAMTIALTGARAKLSEICEISLLVETLDNTDAFTPTTSRVAALVIIDVLAIAIALRRQATDLDRLRDMKEILRKFRPGHLAHDEQEPSGETERAKEAVPPPAPLVALGTKVRRR